MGMFKGFDGQWYDTADEMVGANNRYWQQKEQLDELQKQNKLKQKELQLQSQMAEQDYNLKLIQEENRKQELENQRNHEMNLAKETQEHEEKMRILGLFDKIGLPTTYYDKVSNYLFALDTDEYKIYKKGLTKINKINEEIIVLDEKVDYCINTLKELHKTEDMHQNEETGLEQDESIKRIVGENNWKYMKDKYNLYPTYSKGTPEIYARISNKELSNLSADKFSEFSNYEQIKKILKTETIKMWCFVVGIEIAILLLPVPNFLLSVGWIVGAIIYEIYERYFRKHKSHYQIYELIKDELEKEKKENKPLKEFDNSYEMAYTYFEESIKNINNEIDSLNKKCEGLKKESLKESNYEKAISSRLDEFTNFRKQHYNKDIEKLLLDLELDKQVNEYGLEYIKINKNNKTGDGDIDDYIAYFDELK